MSVLLIVVGLMLLFSLAASDLLISALTADELSGMGLQPD
jgi:hypothetical protein